LARNLVVAACAFCGLLFAQSADSLLKSSGDALDKGDYSKAIEQASEAAKLFEKGSADTKLLAEALNIVGAAYLYQGSYESARPHFERSLFLARAANDPSNEIRLLNNLGSVDFFLGRYVPAFATYQTALDRAKGFEAAVWYSQRQRNTLANLAVLHLQLGQNQRALELYRQALQMPGEIFASERAQMLTNLAVCYRRLGDPYKALDRYRQAQQLLARDPDAAASLYTLHNIGVVQALDLDDPAAALKTFTEALGLASKSGNQREAALEHLFMGEALLRLKRPAEARVQFQQALETARQLQLAAENWTALYGLGRAFALEGDRAAALRHQEQALEIIEPLRSSLTVSSLKAEFLADKRDVYDAVIGLMLDQSPSPPASEIFRRIEQERARNLQDLLPASPRTLAGLAAIQQALPPKTALLEYWVAGDRLAAIRILRDEVQIHQSGLTRQQVAAIEALSKALLSSGGTANRVKQLAAAVSAIVFNPAWKLDGNGEIDKLIVVPDGILHGIPFELLEWGETRGPLVERCDVWYLPAAQFLTRQRESPSRRAAWPWEATIAAFANPLTDSKANPLFAENTPNLVRAESEAHAVASSIPGRARLFLGENNRKSHLADQAVTALPVLHFATHASIDTADSRRSRLLFTPASGDPASQYLFGSEIAGLDLRRVELVTLAACESERGRFVRGEGPESLSRAFLGAGAGASVSSLWKVSDAATERLMASFYAHLGKGESKASALRAAKLEAIRAGGRYAEPYYWAAFVLTGDGHSALPPVIRWWWLGAGAVAGIWAFWIYLRKRGSD
jgi:CHAT domain-containing protein/Flp pilus assembly protein TadD